jgi:mxaJ protein
MLLALCACLPGGAQALVVCADPNNLPFSNQSEQGLENHLARLLGHALHTDVQYEWWAQRRGFARQTLAQSRCDIWPGVASGIQSMRTTIPYYRSTYVFVTRRASALRGLTLDDPRLRDLKIGVQMVGDDGMNTPPAHALARRGLTQNVRGFTLYGDYRRPNPPARIVSAVASGAVDVALVWGPLAGYYARHSTVPLCLEPVIPMTDEQMPMTFAISVGVRKDEPALLDAINAVLVGEAPQIRALLRTYAVPEVEPPKASRDGDGGGARASAPLAAASTDCCRGSP